MGEVIRDCAIGSFVLTEKTGNLENKSEKKIYDEKLQYKYSCEYVQYSILVHV